MKDLSRYFSKYYWLRRFFISRFSNIFFSEKFIRKSTFKHIYKSYHWRDYQKINTDESVSGKGSDLKSTTHLTKNLLDFFNKKKIKRILDIGCGDFLWMNKILDKYSDYEKYLGFDIVEDLITNNIKKYSNKKNSFQQFDLVENEIPNDYDIILVRDVFIHLENKNIVSSLKKLKKNNAIFLGITTAQSLKSNKDLKRAGRYRDLNIEIDPFNLKNVSFKILENNEQNEDKFDCLNIYRISDLKNKI